MNYRGSYRHLLKNSKAALLAAVEIYNKPKIEYRDECFAILLINAWELLFKALVSKNGDTIFYKKKRNEPYRTLSWTDAFIKAERHFPAGIEPLPVRRNLELVSAYRDNALHFYNQAGFGAVIYALAQTSIINYKDLLSAACRELSQMLGSKSRSLRQLNADEFLHGTGHYSCHWLRMSIFTLCHFTSSGSPPSGQG